MKSNLLRLAVDNLSHASPYRYTGLVAYAVRLEETLRN